MRVVDIHQHLWPETLIRALEHRSAPPRIRGGALELVGEPGGAVDYRIHSLDARLALLDQHEIEVALVSLAPTMETDSHEDLRDAYHEGILEVVAASHGRLLALAAGARRPGFVGVCVSAAALEGGADQLLAGLESAGELLFVHPGPPAPLPGDAPRWWSAVADYTAQMQAAYLAWICRDAARFPDLPVVFAMLAGGAPMQLERLGSRGVDERDIVDFNAFFDVSSYGRRALELCLAAFGTSRLVFGSDAPVIDPRPTITAVRALGEIVAPALLHGNADRLLRLQR